MNTVEQNYWETFYSNFICDKPSDFCLFITNYFTEKKEINLKLLDIGCGNGRDSYFLSKIFNVTGIDISVKSENKLNCKFILDNFVTFDKKGYDIIYSRFSFHSINNEKQQTLLENIDPNTYLCIETRSDKCKNIKKFHGENHFRNLTNLDYLKNILINNNFNILFIKESDNFAVYNNENPICIRIICKKIK